MQNNEQDDSTRCVHEDAVKWNPYNKVVQCHRCGKQFTPKEITPAVAVYAFGAWLTMREQDAGPFSRFRDAASMAELVNEYCKFQGWEVQEQDWKLIRGKCPTGDPVAQES